MREQLQEQDRKEAERKPSQAAADVAPAVPINTPLPSAIASAPVELPPQVLEVSANCILNVSPTSFQSANPNADGCMNEFF